MSNVTPREILDLVTKAFGVTHGDMRQSRFFYGKHISFQTTDFKALTCALYLIKRHTGAGTSEICKVIGVSHRRTKMFDGMSMKFKDHMTTNPRVRAIVEWIETEIDNKHDLRMSGQAASHHAVLQVDDLVGGAE